MPAMSKHRFLACGLLMLAGGALLVPVRAGAVVSFYTQLDGSGVMRSVQSSENAPYAAFNSASLGNLKSWQDPYYMTFTMRDSSAGSNAWPIEPIICLQAVIYGLPDCRAHLQAGFFPKSVIDLLADHAFHTLTLRTYFTVATVADGTAPVSFGINGLPLPVGSTQFKSNASSTVPALLLHKVPNGCRTFQCVANVLFLPGIEGSRLYYKGTFNIEHQVWEPDFHTDIPYLAMNADGSSKYSLYTKDIVDTIEAHHKVYSAIEKLIGNKNLDVYGNFAQYMNSLVASSTFGLKQWRAYPYDWRYDVRDIVTNGTATMMPDGTVKQVFLRDVVVDMASSSPTGRVTIVAHSNGGLLAKALAMSFGADAPKYIDKIIMVGTPQLGAPSGIGSMLHGDEETLGLGIISNASDARAAGQNMPDPYTLLPSAGYFVQVSDPVVTFDPGGTLSGLFASSYGSALTASTPLANFLQDVAHLDSQAGSVDNLNAPLPLFSTLIAKAAATHAALDAWVPPWGVDITSIAGWGQDTIKSYLYTTDSKLVCTQQLAATQDACFDTSKLVHTPVFTKDGDGTVGSPSAILNGDAGLYFNAAKYREAVNDNFIHTRLLASKPIQNVISDLLRGSNPRAEQYISTTKPMSGTNPITLRISTHSPVNTLVTDTSGKQSGVVVMPGTDFAIAKREIAGSSVQVMDDEQYINVPQNGTYKIVSSGYAVGPTRLNVDTLDSGGTVTNSTAFTNIPTASNSSAVLTVANGAASSVAVDMTSDGSTDLTIASSTAAITPMALVQQLKVVVNLVPLASPQRVELGTKLREVEAALIAGNTRRVTNRVPALEDFVQKQTSLYVKYASLGRSSVPGIAPSSAVIILDMIRQLETLI